MSLSATLSNALSGLTAASRGAQVVSSNISNALTEGYGRRVLETSAASLNGQGAGVRVDGVRRDIDMVVISDRRLSQAETGQAQTRADALARIEAALGTPDGADSISGRIAALESAFVAAASRPDDNTRLADVLGAAQAVAGSIAGASDDIQSMRMDAEAAIAADVATLNDTLARIADLNGQIRLYTGSGNDANALMDQRQVQVDRLAELVPLREVPRDHGMIALYTESGATLLDGPPAEFGFQPAGLIVPEMTADSGALSGLTLNGQTVRVTGAYAPMGGGQLAALFDQRDSLATGAQSDLDALARDLIDRFAAPGLDPTLASGAPGLFTDQGAVLDPAQESGLSARLAVNAAADPDQGGALWHLRSGLGAASAGPVGASTLLNAYADVLSGGHIVASGAFAGQALSALDLASETVSRQSVAAQRAEQEQGFAAARTSALREAELGGGVDTDAELQDLMLLERAYAANAKVVQTAGDMIQTLLGI
ncbi:MAG: flagellar hook-associated protein FlgK [Rhodobacteraceae bacterium]|nr:flagellar hook-associated protein FlgK [Paracoccaceae bacterium]